MNETKPSPPDWLLNDIAEASRDASRAYLFYIGFLSYCILTVVSTTDRQLVLKNEAVNLPIITINVSISGFFVIAPLLAIAVFIYFQMYLNRLDNLIKELRNSYASTDRGRLSQWMMNIAEGSEHGASGKLEIMIVKFALWWTLPIVLIVFAIVFLKKHSLFLSYIVVVLYPIVGTIITLSFWCVREKVKLKGFIRDPWKITLATLWLIIQIPLIFLIFFKVADYSTWPTVDLSYQKLITEPNPDYKGIYWADLNGVHLEGADLTSSVLKRADLYNAQLQGASLYDANLQEVNLLRANLQKANLLRANLQKADLSGANLQEASLFEANLQGASLFEANLQKANLLRANLQENNLKDTNLQEAILSGANLQGANLFEANLQKADLSGANLQEANLWRANLQKADLFKANLQEANLLDANLQGADLFKANLRKANLQGANLQGAQSLTIEQLSKVKTLYRAKLDSSFMEQIQKDYPHLLEDPE